MITLIDEANRYQATREEGPLLSKMSEKLEGVSTDEALEILSKAIVKSNADGSMCEYYTKTHLGHIKDLKQDLKDGELNFSVIPARNSNLNCKVLSEYDRDSDNWRGSGSPESYAQKYNLTIVGVGVSRTRTNASYDYIVSKIQTSKMRTSINGNEGETITDHFIVADKHGTELKRYAGSSKFYPNGQNRAYYGGNSHKKIVSKAMKFIAKDCSAI